MFFYADPDNVKLYGRTFDHEHTRWCCLSGTGIGFSCQASHISIHLTGDDSTGGENPTEGAVHYAVWINGSLHMDRMLTQSHETITINCLDASSASAIELIKLSECAMSLLGISGIETDAKVLHPLPNQSRRIEFIGDSITCGYGIEAPPPYTGFHTNEENAYDAYACTTARLLKADYSLVSFSGFGVYSGYTSDLTHRSRDLVPPYYDRMGFSYAHPYGLQEISDLIWDFSSFVPDAVIVNLGTNDCSYCNTPLRHAHFRKHYQAFLTDIRAKNPHTEILCILGLMDSALNDSLAKAVSTYVQFTGDQHIHTLLLPRQSPEDGFGADGHPSRTTHRKTAFIVADKLKEILNW